jgi:predicted NAD-dependent protein-ADP-ribosyltransferase YbiA (DUF1768 family)
MAESLIFSASATAAPPGRSKSRYAHVTDPKDPKWLGLSDIADWRRIFSSMYMAGLTIDGTQFASAEHYLQYRKAALADGSKALKLFGPESSLDSWGAWKHRKTVRLTSAQWQVWIDEVRPATKKLILCHKFAAGSICRQALMATNGAQLWSIAPRRPPVRMHNHEALRDSLIEQQRNPTILLDDDPIWATIGL